MSLKSEAAAKLIEHATRLDELRASFSSRAPSLEPARAAAEEASAILRDAAVELKPDRVEVSVR